MFGRRAGKEAAGYIESANPGKPTLSHLDAWNRELDAAGIDGAVQSPILLPKYTRPQ